MATVITKQLAEKIIEKLGAQLVSTGAHSMYAVSHNDQIIASFGLRHGSRKDAGHDHIPDALHIGPGKAKRLGQCPMSAAQWLDCLREKGLLPADDAQQGEGNKSGEQTPPNGNQGEGNKSGEQTPPNGNH